MILVGGAQSQSCLAHNMAPHEALFFHLSEFRTDLTQQREAEHLPDESGVDGGDAAPDKPLLETRG